MTEYFKEIEDTRQQGKIKYTMVEVIAITIIAITAGAEHWNEIELYCKSKLNMLRKTYKLKLENGIPSEDTIQRIFAIIKPEQLERCFVNWIKSVVDVEKAEVVSIDGKTLRGSRNENYSVIHMVSAWANEAEVVLGQLRVDEKSNEIPAVPELLDLIDVTDCIITSDAMSCQKKTVEKIRKKSCDYVICLKGNQETLHEDVKLYFEAAFKEPWLYPKISYVKTEEKDHGRMEQREYYLTADTDWIENREEWVDLKGIGMVRSKRIVNNIESIDERYFITSLTDIKSFSRSVRKHWGIENSLHWCLDINFNEDRCRTRVDNSGENLAVIRHIALNLYKSYTSVKLSMKAKRFRCSFDDIFLASVIFNKFR